MSRSPDFRFIYRNYIIILYRAPIHQSFKLLYYDTYFMKMMVSACVCGFLPIVIGKQMWQNVFELHCAAINLRINLSHDLFSF